jgi:maltose alpha-D-glucosyltransferase / alpha-amylase
MQIFDRGIRRRLAPMVGGRLDLQLLMYSLIFTIPGTPILWYGGMGEDLSQEERNSVRTPMQWTADSNAGFSVADPARLFRPVIKKGPYSYRKVNVQALRRDPRSGEPITACASLANGPEFSGPHQVVNKPLWQSKRLRHQHW